MFTLEVTPLEVVKIGDALAGLPYKEVVQLINKLQKQVVDQESVEKLKDTEA